MTFLFEYFYIEYSYCDTNKSNLTLNDWIIWCKKDVPPFYGHIYWVERENVLNILKRVTSEWIRMTSARKSSASFAK